jgi:hypothetical protein
VRALTCRFPAVIRVPLRDGYEAIEYKADGQIQQMRSIYEKAIANCLERAHGMLMSKNVNFAVRKDVGLWI